MTKNVILNEMLSVCALGFLWGTIQQCYTVILTHLLFWKFWQTYVRCRCLNLMALLKDPLIQNSMSTVSAPKKILEFAIRNRLITVEQLEEIIRKSKGIR